MKKSFIIFLCTAFLMAALAGCAPAVPKESAPASTPAVTKTAPPAPSQPPAPDFSGTSFTGNWIVSKVTASDGTPASENEIKQIGADFTLEILKDGIYFVYNAKGKVLGQGKYVVEKDAMTMTAGDKTTVYKILDGNTMQSAAVDGSITTMSKNKAQPEDAEDDGD